MPKPKNKGGRPRKPTPLAPVTSFRIEPKLKAFLAKEAAKAHRTLTQQLNYFLGALESGELGAKEVVTPGDLRLVRQDLEAVLDKYRRDQEEVRRLQERKIGKRDD